MFKKIMCTAAVAAALVAGAPTAAFAHGHPTPPPSTTASPTPCPSSTPTATPSPTAIPTATPAPIPTPMSTAAMPVPVTPPAPVAPAAPVRQVVDQQLPMLAATGTHVDWNVVATGLIFLLIGILCFRVNRWSKN